MRWKLFASAAFVTSSVAAYGQDFELAQAANTEALGEILAALERNDGAAIAQLDRSIDYSGGPLQSSNSTISSGEMVSMLADCEAEPLEEASRFRDVVIVDFSCPHREPQDNCQSGNLGLMVWSDGPLNIAVVEKTSSNSLECRPAAPPAPPPISRKPK